METRGQERPELWSLVVKRKEFKNQTKDGNRASTTIDSDGKIFESGCVDEFT